MKEILHKNLNYLVFFGLLIFLIFLKVVNPSFIKSISFLSFDLYQKVFAEKKNSQVVIIDIDEKSLGKFGQFPWNRTVFAKILDKIDESNPPDKKTPNGASLTNCFFIELFNIESNF